MVLTGCRSFLQTINAAYQCLLLLRSGIVLLFYLCVRMHFESVNCDIDTRFPFLKRSRDRHSNCWTSRSKIRLQTLLLTWPTMNFWTSSDFILTIHAIARTRNECALARVYVRVHMYTCMHFYIPEQNPRSGARTN